ncbi:6-carboxytetrahydropterin synthase [bacterium]|nr:6-carboxytetrahydropterin synthase [bacterium]
MKIVRELGELAAAHRLLNHVGGCENLHGHNWGITVWVEAPVDSHSGIAVDFLDFDRLRSELFRDFDHGIWLNSEDPLIGVLEAGAINMKLTRVDGEPTAENMAALFLARLKNAFPNGHRFGVRVSETIGSVAELSG